MHPEHSIRGTANSSVLILLVLLMTDSFHFVFARMLSDYLNPLAAVMYVMVIASVELVLFMGIRRQIQFQFFRRHWVFFLSIGALVAGATAFSYSAVTLIDPGTASLLAQTSTVFSLGFSLFWLRERLNRIELTGAFIALAGVFTIAFQPGDYLRLGSLLILSGTFLYALHAAVVKRYGQEMEFSNFFLFRVSTIALFSVAIAAAQQQLILPPSEAWPLLMLTATVDVIISRTLYYLALRRFRLSIHTLLLTLSPAITVLWSFLLFQARPTVQGVLGGLAVISGVALVTRGRQARPLRLRA